jgi:hypothetical protein
VIAARNEKNIALKISLSLNKKERIPINKPTSTQGVLAIGYKIVKRKKNHK